jgi:hypothetical protein
MAISQEVPEIPLKNGLVYYTFTNKLDNTKKCLSTYCSATKFTDFFQKMIAKTQELTTHKSKPLFGKNYTMTASVGQSKGQCIDTTTSGLLILTVPTKIKPTRLYNLGKKKLISQTIEAKIEIVFLSKTEYTLKIKGFTYKTMAMNAAKVETEEHPLGEMYNDFLADDSKSKDQINLFKDVDLMVNEIDRIVKEVFTELYQVDELD